jgi:hypothetical protein
MIFMTHPFASSTSMFVRATAPPEFYWRFLILIHHKHFTEARRFGHGGTTRSSGMSISSFQLRIFPDSSVRTRTACLLTDAS